MESEPKRAEPGKVAYFGTALRKARKKLGAKLNELADHLGVSVPYLSDVERGQRAPLTDDRILQTAKKLSTDPITLLEAAARDRERVVIPIGPGDSNMKVRAAVMIAHYWHRMPRSLVELIIRAFSPRS